MVGCSGCDKDQVVRYARADRCGFEVELGTGDAQRRFEQFESGRLELFEHCFQSRCHQKAP